MDNKIELIRKRLLGQMERSRLQVDPGDPLLESLQSYLTVLEELQVAEEELREQNAQLTQSQLSVLQERQRYLELFEFSPDSYLLTNANGAIQEANRAAIQLLGVGLKLLVGKSIFGFIDGREMAQEMRERMMGSREKVDFEARIKPRSRPALPVSIRLAPVYEMGADRPAGFRWILRDISAQQEALERQRKSEERFRSVFQNATLGIALLDAQAGILECNEAFHTMLGYPQEIIAGQAVTRFIYAEDLPFFMEKFDALSGGFAMTFRLEARFLHQDQHTLWGSVSLSLLAPVAGEDRTIMLMLDDITTEKRIYAERIEMHHRLIDGIEGERTRLARDLHDSSLQEVYGAIYRLVDIIRQEQDETNRAELVDLRMLLHQVSESIRAACGDLRTPALRTFGFEKTVLSFADTMRTRHPELELETQVEPLHRALSDDKALVLYRILQEAVNNAIRHARATRIQLSIQPMDGAVVARVTDNGAGFNMPTSMVEFLREGHYGLAGMHERVEAVGGTLEVKTAPAAGTHVIVRVPA